MSLHGADSNTQRKVLGGIGIVASLVFLVASMAMNWRFGYSLGKSPLDGQIYGGISAAADAFKALCPFFFFAALRDRQWAGAAASAIVWLIVVGYASAGAAGHAGANRMETAGERVLAADHYKDLRSDKDRYEKQLKWLPEHRASDTVKADLEGVKGQLSWTQTTECTDPRGKSQRDFCQNYHKLSAELGNATKADEYNKKIEDIAGKLSGTKGAAAVTDADPQATIISRLLVHIGINLAVADTQTWLAIIVALVLEIGSTFGLYISVQYARGTPTPPQIIDADYKDIPQTPPEQAAEQGQLSSAQTVPLIAHNQGSPQASPAAKANPIISVPPPAPPRSPLPGTESALEAIGIPFKGKRTDPLLHVLAGKEAAEALVAWIRAYGLAREDLSPDEISAYDVECCAQRHRRRSSESDVREALAQLKGAERWRPRVTRPDGSIARPTRYAIKPGRYPKPSTPPPEPDPPQQTKPGGSVIALLTRRPLAVAPERAPITTSTADRWESAA